MGNIINNWFQWGKNNQNDPKSKPVRTFDSPNPNYKSGQEYKDPGSCLQRQEQSSPVQPKETPQPTITSIESHNQSKESISGPEEIKPDEDVHKTTYQIQLQPQAEKLRDDDVDTKDSEQAKEQSDIIKSPVECDDDQTTPVQDELGPDDVAPHVEGAVVKIQAGIRGYLTRKALKERSKPEPGSGTESQADEEKTPEPELVSAIETTLDEGIVENGEEGTMDEAATRIQASFRGYKTRQELKEKQGLDGPALLAASTREAEVQEAAKEGAKSPTLDVKEVVQYGSSSEIQANLESRVTPSIPISPKQTEPPKAEETKPTPSSPVPTTPPPKSVQTETTVTRTPTQPQPRAPAVSPTPVQAATQPPVQQDDEYEEYTDEEEEEEEEEIKVVNTSPAQAQQQARPQVVQPQVVQPRVVQPQVVQPQVVQPQAQQPARNHNEVWNTSSVYQSAGQNQDEEEEEYEEEEEEEEEEELENGNAVAPTQANRPPQPSRPVAPEPRGPAPTP